MRYFIFVLLSTALTYGQQPSPSIQAQSSGKCSPNILSNKGRVQFVCNAAIDTATADKIVILLNRILQQQNDGGDEAEVNRKLDEILGFLRSEAQAHLQRQLPSDQMGAV